MFAVVDVMSQLPGMKASHLFSCELRDTKEIPSMIQIKVLIVSLAKTEVDHRAIILQDSELKIRQLNTQRFFMYRQYRSVLVPSRPGPLFCDPQLRQSFASSKVILCTSIIIGCRFFLLVLEKMNLVLHKQLLYCTDVGWDL